MKRFAILLCLSLLLAACGGRGDVQVERNPEGGATVTVTLTQEDLNLSISEAISDGDNTLLLNPQIVLSENLITVTGDYFTPSGEQRSGTMTVVLGAADGLLTAEVTSVEIEGFDANAERLARINERLASALLRRANRENRVVTVESVSVTAARVEVVLNVQRAEEVGE